MGRISKASAKQRAGRAGRTQPGRVIRLYSEEDYLRRPEHDAPEIARSDLSQLCLALRMMRIHPTRDIEWLDAPPAAALQNAETLLDGLGATGTMAERMARYPLPPRLSRMLVEAIDRRVGDDGCVAAALLGSGARSEKVDLLAAMDADQDFRSAQHLEQLRRIARLPKPARHDDDALLISVLAGFPDRVAGQRAGARVMLSTGVSAEVAGEAPPYAFLVAIDAEDRKDKPLPVVRMTARVEPEWLIDLFPDRIRESSAVMWNRATERVEAVSSLRYDELVIQESRGGAPDAEAAAEQLWRKAVDAGIDRFVDESALHVFQARIDFAGLPQPGIEDAFRSLCSGLLSFAELKNAAKNFISILEQAVDTRRLRELAPESVRLQKGRAAKIHYEMGKPPWIASRLQDFFGMRETPRIGPNRTQLVVHLLAPNQRAVQTTTDLAGFWERLYPQVRRELMRRYPRHAWPDNPIHP
jgi:ATP-dependent helicase HrpB